MIKMRIRGLAQIISEKLKRGLFGQEMGTGWERDPTFQQISGA